MAKSLLTRLIPRRSSSALAFGESYSVDAYGEPVANPTSTSADSETLEQWAVATGRAARRRRV